VKQPVLLRSSARTRLRVVAAALLSLASAHVMACTSSGSNAAYLTADLKSTDAPGTITMLSGSATWMNGCGTPRAHQLEVSLEGIGLKAVSTIDYQGKTYVTYELSATSPLFFFPMNIKTSGAGAPGGFERIPAKEGVGTPVTSYTVTNNQLFSHPHLGVVARAGMQPVPLTQLGTEVAQHTQFTYSNRHAVYVTVNIEQPTCSLSDTAFTLTEISADVVGAVGDSSHEQTFPVKMQCEAAGIPVKLTLTDANDPTATGSLLKPTAHATAEGVQVELLRNGVPVKLGQQWDHGASGNGEQNIDLQARYTRVPGALKIGDVEGQAVITATYR